MDDIKQQLLELLEIDDHLGETRKKRDPFFETIPVNCEIDEKWPLRLTERHSSLYYQTSPDFVRMMQMLNKNPSEERVRSALLALSEEFNRLRREVREKPHLCSPDTFISYLTLLKRVGRFFENSDCLFETYYNNGKMNHQSTHFLYEYMQVLILTTARLYEQSMNRDVIDQKSANDMFRCQQLFDELNRCIDYCLSDKLFQSEKWLYLQSPDAISNSDITAAVGPSRHSVLEQERATLRQFIHHDLQGKDTITARCILFRIKMNEICAELMTNKIKSSVVGTENQCTKLYNNLAPLMMCITTQYNSIVQMLLDRSGSSSLLPRYAQYMSYQWYIKREMVLAQGEWACYQTDGVLEFERYAKYAIRRLCVIQESITKKEKWLLDLKPSENLKKKWFEQKKTVNQLYKEMKESVVDSLWLTASNIRVPEITPLIPPKEEDSEDMISIYTTKWKEMKTKNESLAIAFDFFERLLVSPEESSILLDSTIMTTRTNTLDLCVVKERKLHLDWLVSMISKDGDIHIGKEGCLYLKQEALKLNHLISLQYKHESSHSS